MRIEGTPKELYSFLKTMEDSQGFTWAATAYKVGKYALAAIILYQLIQSTELSQSLALTASFGNFAQDSTALMLYNPNELVQAPTALQNIKGAFTGVVEDVVLWSNLAKLYVLSQCLANVAQVVRGNPSQLMRG